MMRSLILLRGLLLTFALPCLATETPLLVILEETGQSRDELPVLRVHPENARIAALLRRGWAGRMLRLYRWEQTYLRNEGGGEPESAYLLLSNNQGGFPRYGFYLGGEAKRNAAYVDLHRRSELTGDWGSVDQIFPHELGHILLKQLGRLELSGGANQVHAIGVRTDPGVAFDEGFGEHFQILALDDPDAAPETRALLADRQALLKAEERLAGYRRDVLARFAPFARHRMTTPLWFSQVEAVIRYYYVKANRFAREAVIPGDLIRRDLYSAYLLDNVMPGDPHGPPKSPARMLASEGVISALLHRWATSAELRNRYRDDLFYARFGATRAEVGPAENYFLKSFFAIHEKKPQDAAQFAAAYKTSFPDEANAIAAAVSECFLGQPLPDVPAIWLASPRLQTGTTLFDQFRGVPRTHTFDLNAVSIVDLMSVQGMDLDTASAVAKSGPFKNVDDLSTVPGVTQELVGRFQAMKSGMAKLQTEKDQLEAEISIKAILYPYLWRILLAWLTAGIAGGILYWGVRRAGRWRCLVNGFSAALPSLLIGWMKGGFLVPMIAPLILFGILGAVWTLRRGRSIKQSAAVLLAWLAAAMPGVALTHPWL
ncbi:MAG: hypothetical protein HYX75_23715 [Acidobacteria bacterium]|nr:hypothetical protein [Acidobacteriota bacterium]